MSIVIGGAFSYSEEEGLPSGKMAFGREIKGKLLEYKLIDTEYLEEEGQGAVKKVGRALKGNKYVFPFAKPIVTKMGVTFAKSVEEAGGVDTFIEKEIEKNREFFKTKIQEILEGNTKTIIEGLHVLPNELNSYMDSSNNNKINPIFLVRTDYDKVLQTLRNCVNNLSKKIFYNQYDGNYVWADDGQKGLELYAEYITKYGKIIEKEAIKNNLLVVNLDNENAKVELKKFKEEVIKK